jgi:hypothetical protein
MTASIRAETYVDVLIGYLPKGCHHLAIVWTQHASCYDEVCLDVSVGIARRIRKQSTTFAMVDISSCPYLTD